MLNTHLHEFHYVTQKIEKTGEITSIQVEFKIATQSIMHQQQTKLNRTSYAHKTFQTLQTQPILTQINFGIALHIYILLWFCHFLLNKL